jgi:hypothetical protein
MSRLGANALGEVLEPGRVLDCYLGLRLDPAGGREATGDQLRSGRRVARGQLAPISG